MENSGVRMYVLCVQAVWSFADTRVGPVHQCGWVSKEGWSLGEISPRVKSVLFTDFNVFDLLSLAEV